MSDLERLARRCDRYAWFARTAFEVLGAAARSSSQPTRRAVLAAHGEHHAWHLELWTARRPELFTPDGHDDRLDALAAVLDLEGLYGVALPALEQACRAHRSAVDVRVDAPTARCLDLVLADVTADLAEARQLFPANADPAVLDLLATAGGVAGT